MNIIHGHHSKVPPEIDLDTLAHFSILVDYYKCHEITDLFARYLIGKYSSGLPKSRGRTILLWIFVSWVFSNAALFEEMTGLAVKESQGPLDRLCLPLPPTLLGMRP